MSERMKFVIRLKEGERMSDLCREFGVSRKTGHKIAKRYAEQGIEGLSDRRRRPLSSPQKTPRSIIEEVVQLRMRRPTWGPKKIRARLEQLQPEVHWPAASTIGVILKDEGLVDAKRRRRRRKASPTARRETGRPNELWTMDFKGDFTLKPGRRCYPLTVSDHFSRYLLGCEALESTRHGTAAEALENVFLEYGMPRAIRSDNGTPFASTGRFGLTRLGVLLLRLGIELERIEPGHPEQNGRHERMHRTLKDETVEPRANSMLEQQARFDDFRESYNQERPHEALGMVAPATVYKKSSRKYPETLPALEYPLHDFTLTVGSDGGFYIPRKERGFLGTAFAGQRIGCRQVESRLWVLTFMEWDMAYFDGDSRRVLEIPTERTEETHETE